MCTTPAALDTRKTSRPLVHQILYTSTVFVDAIILRLKLVFLIEIISGVFALSCS